MSYQTIFAQARAYAQTTTTDYYDTCEQYIARNVDQSEITAAIAAFYSEEFS